MQVVERPVAAAEPGCIGNRGLNVIASPFNRALNAEALSKASRDRRCEGATGTMGMARRDPRALPDPNPATGGDEDIRNGFPRQMPAFDKSGSATEGKQGFTGSLHLGNVTDCRAT